MELIRRIRGTSNVHIKGSGLIQLGVYTLLGILGIIGFMNMANTMILSIVTRKQKIGVLQAIGMTNRQLNRMLQMEGLLFTVGTVLVSLLIGIPAGYGLFRYGKNPLSAIRKKISIYFYAMLCYNNF